ncbi:MAG: protease modulator HflC [Gammaproteobacteria bacterium]
MRGSPLLIVALLLVVALLGWGFVFTIDQREFGILLRFREIRRSDFEPGLHFKIPFIDEVVKFEKRLMSLDSEPERFLTSEKKDVIVDTFVKWRIADVEKYYRSTQGDVRRAGSLLFQQIYDSLRGAFGRHTIKEVVAAERGDILKSVTEAARAKGDELGVTVVDVRTKRINLPEEVSNAVYDRMRAEREQVAQEFRSRGGAQAETIRANADRQRTVVLAEAYKDSEDIRGAGDARAAELYAAGYGRNTEFYEFYRSLIAYKTSFAKHQDILLLEPTSDFFHYFKKPTGP